MASLRQFSVTPVPFFVILVNVMVWLSIGKSDVRR